MLNKIKLKKINIELIIIIILVLLVFYSFYKYIDEYYNYDYEATVEMYNSSVERCKKQHDPGCDNLEYPLTPKEEFQKLDIKTLFFEIKNHYFSDYAVILLQLFMIIIIVSKVHKYFSSGIIKNYLMREDFKSFKKKINKEVIKTSLILPLCIFLIFIISAILTRFNFKVDESVYQISVYNKWNYNNFYLYLIMHYIILVFTCIFYGNLSLCFINKHKNSFVVTIISYLSFYVVVFIFAFFQIFMVNNFLKSIIDYFNIFDFWHIEGYKDVIGYLVMSVLLAGTSYLVQSGILKNKEKVLIENEKEIV